MAHFIITRDGVDPMPVQPDNRAEFLNLALGRYGVAKDCIREDIRLKTGARSIVMVNEASLFSRSISKGGQMLATCPPFTVSRALAMP